MTKLPIVSSKKVITALRMAGFEDAPKRAKGSHSAMIKRSADGARLVIIPDRKSIPRGTLRAIRIRRVYREMNSLISLRGELGTARKMLNGLIRSLKHNL